MNEFFNEFIKYLVASGVLVAIIEGVRESFRFRRERKAKKEDEEYLKKEKEEDATRLNTEKRLEAIERKTDAQTEALKFVLYDRIRYLGQAYISDREIDFDDRRILNEMHRSYHNGLGGNGDLDVLMTEVNTLPLKK